MISLKQARLRFFILGFLWIGILGGSPKEAQAGGYPQALWNSDSLPFTVVGLAVGPVVNKDENHVVVLGYHQIFIHQLVEGKLSKIFEYNKNSSYEWIKLDLFDCDGDGISEIVVSGFYLGRVQSFIAKFQEGRLKIVTEVSVYLRVLEWEGKSVLISQKRLGSDDFTGPFLEMLWDGSGLKQGREIKLTKGLSPQSIPLFSVEGLENPLSYLYLDSVGHLHQYEALSGTYQKKWTSGQSYGGNALYLNRQVKGVLNDSEQERFFIPLSFHVLRQIPGMSRSYGGMNDCVSTPEKPCDSFSYKPLLGTPPGKGQVIYLIKNEGYLKNVVGAVPSIKNSQLVRLQWSGYGFQEVWNSPRFDGALTDFDLVDWDGDGHEEIITSLLLRNRGYVDTLKDQDSILLVIKPPLFQGR